MNSDKDIRDLVKKAYGSVAKQKSSCCGDEQSCCTGSTAESKGTVTEGELGLSCGNPTVFADLKEGEVVLDLGAGAGKDVFLGARQVGPAGRSIGVDMTPEMVELARKNAGEFRRKAGLENIEFRQGNIENLPIDDGSVDAVISNCVINLSPDKPKVFREVFRVLKAGGRMVVSDIVLNRPLPESLKNDENLYAACIAGALLREDYLAAIRQAGFASVKVLGDKTYEASTCCTDPVTASCGNSLEGIAASITVKAMK